MQIDENFHKLADSIFSTIHRYTLDKINEWEKDGVISEEVANRLKTYEQEQANKRM